METKSQAESDLVQRIASERQAAARANKKRVRYSETLQRDILQFVHAQRLSPETGARRLGLGKSVVRNWLQRGTPRKPRPREPRLQRVEVVSEPLVEEQELRLVFAVGAHVVVSLEQLRQLLGCAS